MKVFLFWVQEIGLLGFLDIGITAFMIYAVLIWFKKTRAAFVLTGILIVAGISIVTRQFNLVMTAKVFEQFFTVILIVLVVIFQEELRHFFEEIAVFSFHRRLLKKRALFLTREEVDILVRTLLDLGRERVGALIVIRGKGLILRHLEGGIDLNGKLSEQLLKSIFDPHSMGHDGALIIEGNRIARFGCYLPLSKNLKKIKDRGTRHAAALGLSEVTDAFCIVVSEERGTISVAQNGEMEDVNDPEKLTLLLERFFQDVYPHREARSLFDFFRKNTREKIYAVVLTMAFWFLFVYGSQLMYKSYVLPVTYAELPLGWEVEIKPSDVEVNLQAPKRSFFFKVQNRVRVFLDLKLIEGEQRIRLTSRNFILPNKHVVLENFEPKRVLVRLKKKPQSANEPGDS